MLSNRRFWLKIICQKNIVFEKWFVIISIVLSWKWMKSEWTSTRNNHAQLHPSVNVVLIFHFPTISQLSTAERKPHHRKTVLVFHIWFHLDNSIYHSFTTSLVHLKLAPQLINHYKPVTENLRQMRTQFNPSGLMLTLIIRNSLVSI